MGCAATQPVTTPVEVNRPQGFARDYAIKQELGKGAFAQVRLCVNKTTQREAAVKIVNALDKETKTKAARELAVWKQVGIHENVVVLLDNYVEPNGHYFVMERCLCNIAEKFPLKGSASCFVDFLGAFQQVFLGLAHCHSMNIVHRDVKDDNLLVDSCGIVKLADFGISVAMPAEGGITGVAGSAPFMSPEMVKGQPYGFETDIWSCGALIYSLVYRSYVYDSQLPWKQLTLEERRKQMLKAIATNNPKPSYEGRAGTLRPSSCVSDFLKKVLQRSAKTRPNADSCAQMISQVKSSLQAKYAQVEPKDALNESCSSEYSTWCPSADDISVVSGFTDGDKSP